MRRSSVVTTLIFAGALAMSAPALAQRSGHGGGGHTSGGGGRSAGTVGAGVRGGGARVRGSIGVSRGAGGAVRGPYVGGARVYRGSNYYRGGGFYASRGVYGGRYWNVAPIHYYRPYYAFRPYFNVGFGLWAGYPFAWSYPYYYPYYSNPYPYAYPYQYPYTTGDPGYSVAPPVNVNPETSVGPNSANGQPDQSNLGGLSFEITPSDSQIYIDGNLVGTVAQFTPTSQPLGVPAGRHHVEIRQSGYKTMSFDVDVVAGQVIPYQGQMER